MRLFIVLKRRTIVVENSREGISTRYAPFLVSTIYLDEKKRGEIPVGEEKKRKNTEETSRENMLKKWLIVV